MLLRVRIRWPLALLMLGTTGAWMGGCSTPRRPSPTVPAEPDLLPPPEPAASAGGSVAAPTLPPASINRAVELLDNGEADAARIELQRVLRADPRNQLADKLLHHLKIDPQVVLGRESYAYTVKPNETLSRIAQRVLGDPYDFYLLARYNNIRVPRMVSGGQVIRLPGKPPAPPPPAPVRATAPPPAVEPVQEPDDPPPLSRVDRLRVNAAVRRGYERLKQQDLRGSLQEWDLVLQLDPKHREARRERARVLRLWTAWCKKRDAGSRAAADCPPPD